MLDKVKELQLRELDPAPFMAEKAKVPLEKEAMKLISKKKEQEPFIDYLIIELKSRS